MKGGTKDCFLFDNWFVSKKAAEAAMEVGADFIGMVKTNTKVFCKETIENITKFNFYEVCISEIIHYPLFYFKTIITPFFSPGFWCLSH